MKTVKKLENSSDLIDRAAQRVATSILQLQQRAAFFLNRKAARIPARILKSYFFIFCFLFGFACFWIIMSAILVPSGALVKPDHSVNEHIGAPSEMAIDTAHTPSVNTKK